MPERDTLLQPKGRVLGYQPSRSGALDAQTAMLPSDTAAFHNDRGSFWNEYNNSMAELHRRPIRTI